MKYKYRNRIDGRILHRLTAVLAGTVIMTAVMGMTGCRSQETVEATILDGACQTIISVIEGETVEEILARAEIVLSDHDEVSPAVEETISESDPTITIKRYAAVTVSDGDSTTELELNGGTVQDALDAAGIELNENDRVNHQPEAYLTTGMEICVDRFYSVTLSVTGEERTLVTDLTTVEELLQQQGVVYDEDDHISPAVEEAIYDGMEIVVEYVSSAQITEEEEIAYETVYQESDTLYVGETEVSQEGENGVLTRTYEVIYVEGKEESRTLVSEEITKEAVDEIILTGTKERAAEKTTENESAVEEEEDETVSSDGRKIISKEKVYDCDGSGNGYYIITYEDGTIEYEDFYN